MAAGDVYVLGPSSIADTGYLTVQPTPGTEIVIHNIWHEGQIQIERYDGATACSGGTITPAPRLESRLAIHCTNGNYLRIQNTSGVAAKIAVDGIYTK